MVKYIDSSGWTWEVCELADQLDEQPPPPNVGRRSAITDRADGAAPATGDGLAGDGTLYFISRRGTRKLCGYPRVWSSLPREQLEALCDRAVAIGIGPY